MSIQRFHNRPEDRVIEVKVRVNDLTYEEATTLCATLRLTMPGVIKIVVESSLKRTVETEAPFTRHRPARTRRGYFEDSP